MSMHTSAQEAPYLLHRVRLGNLDECAIRLDMWRLRKSRVTLLVFVDLLSCGIESLQGRVGAQ